MPPRKPKADRKAPEAKKPKVKKAKADSAGAKKQEQQASRGPQIRYTPELGERICELLAEGQTLNRICKADDMPASRTVRRWALDLDHPFSPLYTKAREIGYHKMADEIIDIADDGENDWIERQNSDGEPQRVFNAEAVARSRVRIDTRKWLLSKALPKIYGDKVALTDADGGKLVIEFAA